MIDILNQAANTCPTLVYHDRDNIIPRDVIQWVIYCLSSYRQFYEEKKKSKNKKGTV